MDWESDAATALVAAGGGFVVVGGGDNDRGAAALACEVAAFDVNVLAADVASAATVVALASAHGGHEVGFVGDPQHHQGQSCGRDE